MSGATAARAVIGSDAKLGDVRGRRLDTPFGIPAIATYLTAYVLRREGPDYDEALATLRNDLHAVRRLLVNDNE